MGNEIRNRIEGNLSWVQASGSGTTWATASAPASAVPMAYVTNFTWTSAQTLIPAMNRGVPTHFKQGDKAVIDVSFTINEAITGEFPNPQSGSGASMPIYHFEFKQNVPENPNVTGIYYQFHGVAKVSRAFTEGDLNENAYTMQALAMSGANNTGYLS